MFTQVIKLKTGKTLKDAALEIQSLNSLVGTLGLNPKTGLDWFPRAIKCNPNAINQEDFLGSVNTPPDADGYVDVKIENYDYLDWSVLPAQPTTFSLVSGRPDIPVFSG